MKNLIIQPYGLGDHIICNALIRHICDNNNEFFIAVKSSHIKSVEFMFKDIRNLKCIEVDNCGKNPMPISEEGRLLFRECAKIIISHDLFLQKYPELFFDEIYYKSFGMNLSDKWDKFYIKRDKDAEQKLFDSLKINSDYILLHEDNRFHMSDRIWDKNILSISINPKLTDNVFDYLTLIENAKEIHCIESFFLFLTDTTKTKAKLFSHRYSRNYEKFATPNLRLDWKILTEQPIPTRRSTGLYYHRQA